jgi:lipopolysaccharide export system protein LptA
MTFDFARNGMKPINCMALSMLLALLILLMTACHAASPANKSSTHINYGLEHQSRHNYPVVELTSNTVTVERDKNTVIFKGNAELKRDHSIKFLADYISIEFPEDNKINYLIEMKGNVSMMTSAVLTIKSEQATSLDFRTYIDFVENVSISNRGQHYKTDWVRYHFPKGELQFRWDDIPTRGHITR